MKNWKSIASVYSDNTLNNDNSIKTLSKSKSCSDIHREDDLLRRHFPVKFIDICVRNNLNFCIAYDKNHKPYLINKKTKVLYSKPESIRYLIN